MRRYNNIYSAIINQIRENGVLSFNDVDNNLLRNAELNIDLILALKIVFQIQAWALLTTLKLNEDVSGALSNPMGHMSRGKLQSTLKKEYCIDSDLLLTPADIGYDSSDRGPGKIHEKVMLPQYERIASGEIKESHIKTVVEIKSTEVYPEVYTDHQLNQACKIVKESYDNFKKKTHGRESEYTFTITKYGEPQTKTTEKGFSVEDFFDEMKKDQKNLSWLNKIKLVVVTDDDLFQLLAIEKALKKFPEFNFTFIPINSKPFKQNYLRIAAEKLIETFEKTVYKKPSDLIEKIQNELVRILKTIITEYQHIINNPGTYVDNETKKEYQGFTDEQVNKIQLLSNGFTGVFKLLHEKGCDLASSDVKKIMENKNKKLHILDATLLNSNNIREHEKILNGSIGNTLTTNRQEIQSILSEIPNKPKRSFSRGNKEEVDLSWLETGPKVNTTDMFKTLQVNPNLDPVIKSKVETNLNPTPNLNLITQSKNPTNPKLESISLDQRKPASLEDNNSLINSIQSLNVNNFKKLMEQIKFDPKDSFFKNNFPFHAFVIAYQKQYSKAATNPNETQSHRNFITEFIKPLVDAGFNISGEDAQKNTPLGITSNKDLTYILIQHSFTTIIGDAQSFDPQT